jgi:hypothetical protein
MAEGYRGSNHQDRRPSPLIPKQNIQANNRHFQTKIRALCPGQRNPYRCMDTSRKRLDKILLTLPGLNDSRACVVVEEVKEAPTIHVTL